MAQSVLTIIAPALVAAAGALVAPAQGSVIISQGSNPSYANTLTFDQPGEPTGDVPTNSWTGLGISSLAAGTGNGFVSTVNTNPGYSWLGTGNVFYGSFGVFLNLSQDVTSFSAQYWDSSGPATFSGGGAGIFVLDHGVEVANLFVDNPAFGGAGNPNFNIVATGGMTFDEVRFVGFGFPADAYVDNISWTTVPAPSSAALFALGGVAMMRRRRA